MWHRLFGSFCTLCRQRIVGRAGERGVCDHCFAELPWRTDPEAHELSGGLIERVVVPWYYAGAAQSWVLAAKREPGLVAGHTLGRLLAEALEDAYGSRRELPARIIPVPLAWQRLLRRGHNQAHWIAAPVARAFALPIDARSVRRRRHTTLQPGQSAAARRRNLADAFASRKRFTGERIAIVDDVLTTGATVEALARCLLEAGAGSVHCWAAAAAMTPPADLPGSVNGPDRGGSAPAGAPGA